MRQRQPSKQLLTKEANSYGANSQISLRGSTTLHFGALSAPIEIKKSVTIAGLNHLQGFSLGAPRMVLPAEPDGTNLEGNLTLANPGAVAIKFGNLAFNVSVAGIYIGNLSISDVLLAHGNNTVPFRGQLLLDTVVSNINTILGSSTGGANGTVDMAISGGTCLVDGQHITYIENVLDATTLHATISLQKLLTDGLSGVMGTNSTSNLGEAVNDILRAETSRRASSRDASDRFFKESGRDIVDGVKQDIWLRSRDSSDILKAAELYQRLAGIY